MATRLRRALAATGAEIRHAQALELVAQQLGHRDWNTLVASAPQPSPVVTIPVLRTFRGPEADRFYLDFLGFDVDWEHRFEPGLPLYRQVSREGCVLHLSEHHGDATPGSKVRIEVTDVASLQRRLAQSPLYPLRSGIEEAEWGADLEVPDPFGNRLVFCVLR